ncbi:copper transport outer membrane protein [Caudoviricetes sp.]|nr:copper transport outer membrane protein [Caudoviricetes sp.]
MNKIGEIAIISLIAIFLGLSFAVVIDMILSIT